MAENGLPQPTGVLVVLSAQRVALSTKAMRENVRATARAAEGELCRFFRAHAPLG